MATDPGLVGYFSQGTLHALHVWGGPVGAAFTLGMGYFLVGKHRRLKLDEILAGVGLALWIVVDRISDNLFGADLVKVWSVRGVLIVVMAIAYAFARSKWHIEEQEA